MKNRTAEIKRRTTETDIKVTLNLDTPEESNISTGIRFLDHLLITLAKHSCFGLSLSCNGDVEVDDHHTAEDCALALGLALDKALGDRRGIARFGWAYAPLDEALARVVVDLSGRPFAAIDFDFVRDKIGDLSTENISHVVRSMASACRAAIHVDVLKGENDHHRAEAVFKALALALRQAVSRDENSTIPSTKGVLL